MISHNAQHAVEQVIVTFALMGVALLLAAVIAGATGRAKDRLASRERLARMPKQAPADLDAGRKRLLAAIPTQRAGGERRAR